MRVVITPATLLRQHLGGLQRSIVDQLSLSRKNGSARDKNHSQPEIRSQVKVLPIQAQMISIILPNSA